MIITEATSPAAAIASQLPGGPGATHAIRFAANRFSPMPMIGMYPTQTPVPRPPKTARARGAPLTANNERMSAALSSPGHTGSAGFRNTAGLAVDSRLGAGAALGSSGEGTRLSSLTRTTRRGLVSPAADTPAWRRDSVA